MARMVTCAPCRVKVGFAASLSWSPYSDSLAVLPLATAIVRFAVASGWLYLLPLPTPEPVASVGAPSASLVDARPGKIGGVRHTFLVGPPAAAYPRNPPRFLNLSGQQLAFSWGVTFFLPSRLSRVRSPSPAPGLIRRYNACMAKAAQGRPPAFEAGRRGWVSGRASPCRSASRGFESHPALQGLHADPNPSFRGGLLFPA